MGTTNDRSAQSVWDSTETGIVALTLPELMVIEDELARATVVSPDDPQLQWHRSALQKVRQVRQALSAS